MLYLRKGPKDVNSLRYFMYCAYSGEIESHQRPPCEDALFKYCQRANYQTAVWKRSLETFPSIPSPVGSGQEVTTEDG